MSKCETGCMTFTGGEIRHHKDCTYYPESLSKIADCLRSELAEVKVELRNEQNARKWGAKAAKEECERRHSNRPDTQTLRDALKALLNHEFCECGCENCEGCANDSMIRAAAYVALDPSAYSEKVCDACIDAGAGMTGQSKKCPEHSGKEGTQ